jgi:hypothetical protein
MFARMVVVSAFIPSNLLAPQPAILLEHLPARVGYQGELNPVVDQPLGGGRGRVQHLRHPAAQRIVGIGCPRAAVQLHLGQSPIPVVEILPILGIPDLREGVAVGVIGERVPPECLHLVPGAHHRPRVRVGPGVDGAGRCGKLLLACFQLGEWLESGHESDPAKARPVRR